MSDRDKGAQILNQLRAQQRELENNNNKPPQQQQQQPPQSDRLKERENELEREKLRIKERLEMIRDKEVILYVLSRNDRG